MKIKFNDSYLEQLAKDEPLIGKQKFSTEVIRTFKKRIYQINNAKDTQVLREYKGLHFEKLKEKRYEDKYSIKLDNAYRIIFGIDKQGGVEIIEIDEISNHYS